MPTDHRSLAYRWITDLVESLDAHLDLETRIRVMESCGQACARSGPLRAAEACHGNLDAWLATLAEWHGGQEYVRRDGDLVHVICAECLCPLMKDGPGKLPDTFCDCSIGWMKETFGAVMGHPVDVELVASIKRGAEQCRLVIRLA